MHGSDNEARNYEKLIKIIVVIYSEFIKFNTNFSEKSIKNPSSFSPQHHPVESIKTLNWLLIKGT